MWNWQGPTVPPQGNFRTNASDILDNLGDVMQSFRFHQWLTCDAQVDNELFSYIFEDARMLKTASFSLTIMCQVSGSAFPTIISRISRLRHGGMVAAPTGPLR